MTQNNKDILTRLLAAYEYGMTWIKRHEDNKLKGYKYEEINTYGYIIDVMFIR